MLDAPKDEALDALFKSCRALEGVAWLFLALSAPKTQRDIVDFEGLGELVLAIAADVRSNADALLEV